MCSCLRGVSRWFTPLACGPGYPELSKSYMDMASKLFTFTFTFTRQYTHTHTHTHTVQSCVRYTISYTCVTRRKHHRPGIAPSANTTHVPTAGSSAAPTKPNHTPSRHSRAKGKLLLQTCVAYGKGYDRFGRQNSDVVSVHTCTCMTVGRCG